MAIFRPNQLIASISGPLQGLAFRITRHGPVIATRPQRRPTTSPHAMASHSAHQTLSLQWRSLDPSFKDAWTAAARNLVSTDRLRLPRIPSGRAFYIAHNAPALYLNQPQVTTPPTQPPLPAIHSVSFNFATGGPYLLYYTIPGPITPVWVLFDGAVSPYPAPGLPTPAGWIPPQYRFPTWARLAGDQQASGAQSATLQAVWDPRLPARRPNQLIAIRLRTWTPDAITSPTTFSGTR